MNEKYWLNSDWRRRGERKSPRDPRTLFLVGTCQPSGHVIGRDGGSFLRRVLTDRARRDFAPEKFGIAADRDPAALRPRRRGGGMPQRRRDGGVRHLRLVLGVSGLGTGWGGPLGSGHHCRCWRGGRSAGFDVWIPRAVARLWGATFLFHTWSLWRAISVALWPLVLAARIVDTLLHRMDAPSALPRLFWVAAQSSGTRSRVLSSSAAR